MAQQKSLSNLAPSDKELKIQQMEFLAANTDVSPGMRQFFALKAKHIDYLLFYRMGDFYELFFDDAIEAASLLGIALTKRGKINGEDTPMCGVPVHSSDGYLERLIAKGRKVAICEQLEDPAEAKKRGSKSVVHRDVVRIVTAGTITEENLLSSATANFLSCYINSGDESAFAWVDISTGEFKITTSSDQSLANDISTINPKEILLDEAYYDSNLRDKISEHETAISFVANSYIELERAKNIIKDYYKIAEIDILGEMSEADIIAIALLLDYISITQKDTPARLDIPIKHTQNDYMVIDAATRRNLELLKTLSGEREGSLIDVINKTKTSAGSRKLTGWLSSPLTCPNAINHRLDGVELLFNNNSLCDIFQAILKECPDIERSMSRLVMGRGGPRDMQAIATGLEAISSLRLQILTFPDQDKKPLPKILHGLIESLGQHSNLTDKLSSALKADLPLLARDGGFINEGYNPALDNFRQLRDDSRKVIAVMQKELADKTKIPSLKIKFNNVLGYFIEITNLHADKAPEEFIHRQTMKGNLRYSTVELADIAQKISESAGKIIALELSIFEELLADIIAYSDLIAKSAKAYSTLDALCSLATIAVENQYTRPKIDSSDKFNVISARHPVVENVMKKSSNAAFIGNDCDLSDTQKLWLITGPNMAGKSTFLRQNALIVILAQMGGFVPAQSAHIGIVDKLFSRVGAADDLARGRSTFMVEMVETATILSQSTPKSLVILDEIGRGTATFDGLSIAWAVVEHLHNKINCRGLFATHYHELTELSDTLSHLSCHYMQVKEWKGDVIFMHKVKEGTAGKSYGIHVAKIAGLPSDVLGRASEILDLLQQEQSVGKKSLSNNILPLFSYEKHEEEIIADESNPTLEKLANINPDELTPKQALELFYELRAESNT